MKSKYKFTSSRHIEGGGKLVDACTAIRDGGMRGDMPFETELWGVDSFVCDILELSLVHWIPRSEQ
jgi:hypothetical protein